MEDEFDDWDQDAMISLLDAVECEQSKPKKKQKTILDFIDLNVSTRNSLSICENTQHHQINALALQSWVYPTNYPERAYQFNIVQSCISKNTLVALPTGLGKTFIASVVMYNYLRWFNSAKIVFMAPTKPLVRQQIYACQNIVKIPKDTTIELTGTISQEIRVKEWQNRRCFFVTPQIMENDLKAGICPPDDICLLVIDEAHRAVGNYSYCEVVKYLQSSNAEFRVLALSATPGSDAKTVQQVVDNLMIQKMELRTEESLDIRPYIHDKQVKEIVVEPSAFMKEISKKFCSVLEPFISRLVSSKAMHAQNPENVSSYNLIRLREAFRKSNQNPAVEGDFAVAISLSRIFALLNSHGVQSFYDSLTEYIDEAKKQGVRISAARQKLIKDSNLADLLSLIKLRMDTKGFVSHPKVERLVAHVVNHFVGHQDGDQNETRVMIFSQYRVSVDEIVKQLNVHQPMIRCMHFIGQANGKKKGLAQKEQLKVIQDFKSGVYNVLVSTSIGEEGLDIGEVDLIICFDSLGSPLRLLQRMGRTGKEEDQYKSAQQKYKNVQKVITASTNKLSLYNGPEFNIPFEKPPICEKQEMAIHPIETPAPKVKGKSLTAKASPWLNDTQQKEYDSKYASIPNIDTIDLTRYPHRQTNSLGKQIIPRSKIGATFVQLMGECQQLYLDNNENVGVALNESPAKPQVPKKREIIDIIDESSDLDFEPVKPKNRKMENIKQDEPQEPIVLDPDETSPIDDIEHNLDDMSLERLERSTIEIDRQFNTTKETHNSSFIHPKYYELPENPLFPIGTVTPKYYRKNFKAPIIESDVQKAPDTAIDCDDFEWPDDIETELENVDVKLLSPEPSKYEQKPPTPLLKEKIFEETPIKEVKSKRRLVVMSSSPASGLKPFYDKEAEFALKRSTPLLDRLAVRKQPRAPPKQRTTPILTKEKKREAKQPKVKKTTKSLNIHEFYDLEAELSSQDGSVSADETDGEADEQLNSFIVSQGSASSPASIHQMYRTSLVSPNQQKIANGQIPKRLRYCSEAILEQGTDSEGSLAEFIVNDEDESQEIQSSATTNLKPWQYQKEQPIQVELDSADLDLSDLVEFDV